MRGDRDRLAQVVGNLLSNAIKYSPEGGTVEVSATLIGDEAWIWVRDEGLGIPTEHQDQIFTKFFRGDVGRELGIAGTGLGLVLARQIVEAHGGEIGFESDRGRGLDVLAPTARALIPRRGRRSLASSRRRLGSPSRGVARPRSAPRLDARAAGSRSRRRCT